MTDSSLRRMVHLRQSASRTYCSLRGQGATQLGPRPTYRPLRGQGATEYLLILAVVLIIGLVVVGLLSFYPGTASDTGITQSQIYWNTARVFSIKEASAESGSGCGSGTGGFRLVMHNTALEEVVLTNVSFDGQGRVFCEQGSPSGAPAGFGISEKKTIVVEYAEAGECSAGQFASKDVIFTYNQGDSEGLVQHGSKRLMLRCSS